MLGVADNEWAADMVASGYTAVRQPQLDATEAMGEETDYEIRVRPVGGQYRIERWDRSALDWEQADLEDNPLQEADVAFP